MSRRAECVSASEHARNLRVSSMFLGQIAQEFGKQELTPALVRSVHEWPI